MSVVKEQAKQLVERLPEQATWDDLMHALYVHQKLEAGLEDVRQGRVVPHDEVKRHFLG